MKKLHPLGELCLRLDIEHHKIKPRTLRHNDKVERSQVKIKSEIMHFSNKLFNPKHIQILNKNI